MSSTLEAQHPAVVLRSSYQLVRALLAVATIAIIGLTVAVVVLAINSGTSTPARAAARATHSVTSTPVVQPNPDEQGVAVPPSSNISYFYPGHF